MSYQDTGLPEPARPQSNSSPYTRECVCAQDHVFLLYVCLGTQFNLQSVIFPFLLPDAFSGL